MTGLSMAARSSAAPKRRIKTITLAMTSGNSVQAIVDTVISPYQHADVDKLNQEAVRVLNPIEMMYRRNEIDQAQKNAADKYRLAMEQQGGYLTGTLNPDKVGGGGLPDGISLALLNAGQTLREARAVLGEVYPMARIIQHIVGEDHSVDGCVQLIYGAGIDRRRKSEYRLVVKNLLGNALTALAQRWGYGEHRPSRSRPAAHPGMQFGEKAMVLNVPVERGAVAHAASDKVDYSGSR